MFEIKKNQKKMPQIDFGLKLDAYHKDENCLHCKKGVLNEFMYSSKH